MSRSVVFWLSIVVAQGCSSGFEETANAFFSEVQQANPAFDVPLAPRSFPDPPKIQLRAQLWGSSSSGQLQAGLVLRHERSTPLVLNTADFILHTPNGNFSPPVSQATGLSIPPNVNYCFSLVFQPVHDRKFFLRTGMKGDLNKQYTLQVKLPGAEHTYPFAMPDSTWRVYLQNYAVEGQAVLFKPTLHKEAQQAYQVASGRPAFVHWDENEITMAGVNLQLNSYHWLDTLYLNFKLVNHSAEAWYVHPGELQNLLDLGNDHELANEKNGPYMIRRSQRWIKKYQSYLPVSPDSLIVPKKWITSDSLGREPLLAEDIVFVR